MTTKKIVHKVNGSWQNTAVVRVIGPSHDYPGQVLVRVLDKRYSDLQDGDTLSFLPSSLWPYEEN